ncbi:MAG: hypothetical protein KC615_00415 [Anaerolineae bacterium]|nr:hypothetical protein [Anaerolineae bacterium]
MEQENELNEVVADEDDTAGEAPATTLEREDNRWGRAHWLRDWAILLIMVIAYLMWAGTIYLFEPGIR